jgi:hypothetical protein
LAQRTVHAPARRTGVNMNASLAIAPQSFAARASDRLESTNLLTRVLLFSTSTLAGAVLYLGANWPGSQPPIIVAITPLPPVATAPPPPEAAVQARAGIEAGPLVAEAVRAVGAASKTTLEARASSAAVPATAPIRIAPAVSAPAREELRPAVAPVLTTSNATAAASSGSPALDVSLQPRGQNSVPQGPNRISVPGAQPPPALPPAPAQAQPPAGANRIAVPTEVPAP